MSEMGPGCVKTCTNGEGAELFSPSSSFDGNGQCCSFPIQRNRDKISTRKFDIGVFTQPGSQSDPASRDCDVRYSPPKQTLLGTLGMSVLCSQRRTFHSDGSLLYWPQFATVRQEHDRG